MKKVIESEALLVICCEGDSNNLTEEKYYKQLNRYVKLNSPKWIKFNEIAFIKVKVNEILNIDKLVKKLEAKGIRPKFSSIVIWKDNDDQDIIQEQNSKICSMEGKLFENLKKYLRNDKRQKENFNIWILPKGWNFETFYRKHFTKLLKDSDSKLKEKFIKETDHFLNKLFKEENFRTISHNLKRKDSKIDLFNFDYESKTNSN